ncbi:MAG TPA: LysR family transcriptional regulator [Syntrophomonas sp.]|nr:LysR family transcriptional regulator [Syntrophomonas sp.]HRW13389.1 LysR family transcriptional regulator [Syntrophomonas sp.]
MFFNQLEIIPVIAETKSFSKAARLLHLSQPAISSKVQAMEDYYKVKFFNRTAQGVTLTEAGKVVLAYADRLISLHQSMDTDLQQINDLYCSSLSIGASCTAGNFAMPCSIQAFKAKYPASRIKLDIDNTNATLKKLLNKEIDVAVVEGQINFPGVVSQFLDRRELVLVFPNTDAFKCRKEIRLRDLKEKPFVMREKGAAIPAILKSTFSDLGYDLYEFNIVSEMNSIHSVKAAVEGGMGVSIVPRIAVTKELNAGALKEVKIKEIEELFLDVNLVYRADEEPSHITRRFIRFLTHANNSGLCWNGEKKELLNA